MALVEFVTFFRNQNFNGKHLAKLRYKNNVIEFQNTKMMTVESMELFIKPKQETKKIIALKKFIWTFKGTRYFHQLWERKTSFINLNIKNIIKLKDVIISEKKHWCS